MARPHTVKVAEQSFQIGPLDRAIAQGDLPLPRQAAHQGRHRIAHRQELDLRIAIAGQPVAAGQIRGERRNLQAGELQSAAGRQTLAAIEDILPGYAAAVGLNFMQIKHCAGRIQMQHDVAGTEVQAWQGNALCCRRHLGIKERQG